MTCTCNLRHPLSDPFAAMSRTGSKWSLSDFYPEHKHALMAALEAGVDFAISWSAKKECHWARVQRRGSVITVTAGAAMDDGLDLIDTAVEKALGENDGRDGSSLAVRLGLDVAKEDEEDAADERMGQWLAEASDLGIVNEGENESSETYRFEVGDLNPVALMDRIEDELDRLEEIAERCLRGDFDLLVGFCKEKLQEVSRG